MNNCPQCTVLRMRVSHLESELAASREALGWYVTHSTLARGIAGERLVAKATGGQITLHTAKHDIELRDGECIEVKSAKITMDGNGKKWQWNKIFGQTGRKNFDYLVLVGEADPKYIAQYRYPDRNIVFLIPSSELDDLIGGRDKDGVQKISLTPNPDKARGTGARLYEYQTDVLALERTISLQACV